MNLRTLKQLSKRAAPLLPLLGDHRQQFPARRGDNYHGMFIRARKHFERGRSVHADIIRDDMIKKPAADGEGWVYMHPPSHPRKGTIMVGGMEGYEGPEWYEKTAWEALVDIVFAECTMWSDEGPQGLTRPLNTPSLILAAAKDLAAVVHTGLTRPVKRP